MSHGSAFVVSGTLGEVRPPRKPTLRLMVVGPQGSSSSLSEAAVSHVSTFAVPGTRMRAQTGPPLQPRPSHDRHASVSAQATVQRTYPRSRSPADRTVTGAHSRPPRGGNPPGAHQSFRISGDTGQTPAFVAVSITTVSCCAQRRSMHGHRHIARRATRYQLPVAIQGRGRSSQFFFGWLSIGRHARRGVRRRSFAPKVDESENVCLCVWVWGGGEEEGKKKSIGIVIEIGDVHRIW